jgi:hypothetical protein
VHQVDPKDSGSQNFSFLAFKVTSVASRQISSNNGGEGGGNGDNGGNGGNGDNGGNGACQTKNFYRSNHVIYS